MDGRLRSKLEHAETIFGHHKDLQEWQVERGLYRKTCMNCGASVVVDPNSNSAPAIIGESRITNQRGEIEYCLKIHEYDRLKRLGK